MNKSAFFLVGDMLANLLMGAVAGIVAWLVVDPGWNMVVAMFAAMALCMAVSLIIWVPVSAVLGAVEPMVQLMFSGMMAGMAIGMWAAMMPVPPGTATLAGAACGGACLLLLWCLHAVIGGRKTYGGVP